MADDKYLSTGVKINVDTSDLDVKFAKSAEQLNETLSKSQKELKLFYNESGMLTNGLGQCVEGLTLSQIKLGQYVDELGNVRTFQGGFVDGLTKTQIALGFYADEFGNVFNSIDELVGKTKKAESELEKIANEAKSAFDGGLDGIEQFSGQFAQLFAILEQGDGPMAQTSRQIISISEGVSAGITAFKATQSLLPMITRLTAATKGLAAVSTALTGPWGVAFAAITGLAAGGATLWATYEQGKSSVDGVSDAFLELQKRAKAAGVEIKNAADAAKFGFSDALGVKTYAEEVAALKQIETKIEAQRKAAAEQNARYVAAMGGGMSGGASAANFSDSSALKALEKERDAANARVVAAQEALIGAAVENSRTELEKLEIQKSEYVSLLEQLGGAAGSKETRAYIALLDEKIAAERQKELDAAAKSADEEKKRTENAAQLAVKEREARLRSLGIFDYIPQSEMTVRTTVETFCETVERWRRSVGGDFTRSDFESAVETFRKQTRENLFLETGVDASAFAAKNPVADFASNARRFETALESGAISQDEYASARSQLRDAARSAFGFDAEPSSSTQAPTQAFSNYQEWLLSPGKDESPESFATALEAKTFVAADDPSFAAYRKACVEYASALRSGILTQEEISEKLASFGQEADKARLDSLGYSSLLEESARIEERSKTSIERLTEERNRFADALKKSQLTQSEYDKAVAALDVKERETFRSELGVDALLESLKTPADKYADLAEKIESAFRANAISERD